MNWLNFKAAIDLLIFCPLTHPPAETLPQLRAAAIQIFRWLPLPATSLELPDFLFQAGLRVFQGGFSVGPARPPQTPWWFLVRLGVGGDEIQKSLVRHWSEVEADRPGRFQVAIMQLKASAAELANYYKKKNFNRATPSAWTFDHPQDWPEGWHESIIANKTTLAKVLPGCSGREELDRLPLVWAPKRLDGIIFLEPIPSKQGKQVQRWKIWCKTREAAAHLRNQIERGKRQRRRNRKLVQKAGRS